MTRQQSRMSRLSPSRGDRNRGGAARPVGVAEIHRKEVAPPPLTAGHVRCPVCRNAASLTKSGVLRVHRDLFANPCLNRATGERVHLDVLPPVVFDDEEK